MSSNLKVNTILPSTGTAIGIGTASGNIDVLGHIVGHNTPNLSGINSVTANTFYGSGANLTGLSGVSVANQADNRLITATGTTDALNGESGATYDGSDFTVSSGRLKLTDESSGAQFRIGAGNDFQIEHDGSNSYIYNLTNDLVLQNDASVKITPKSGGTQRFRFDSDGLKFGTDSSSDNALDDYEKGAWTPVLSNDGTAFTSVSNSSSGHYTKIGNVVTLTMYHRTDGVTKGSASDSDNVIITGLPFTPNGNIQRNFVNIGFNVNWAQYPNQALIQESTAHIALYKYASSGGNNTGTRLTVAAVNTGSNSNYCLVTMVYRA